MRKRTRVSKERKEFTPAQAKLILDQLVRTGSVTRSALSEAEKSIEVERQGLIARLRELGGLPAALMAAGAAGAAVAAVPRVRRSAARVARKVQEIATKVTRAEITPERARTRQLQGKYLGLTHQVPKDVVRKQFGKEAIAARGKEAVIAEMESYVRSHGKTASNAAADRAGSKEEPGA